MTTFTTKEEYLKYRQEWKEEYKELSKEIRRLKQARKQFKWQYRKKGMNAVKRKVKFGDNIHYDSSAHWKVNPLRSKARRMMEELVEAKQLSWELKQKRLQEAA